MNKKEYNRKWREDNPDKVKEYNKRQYAKNKSEGKRSCDKSKLDYYVVYYLPKEHYCGHTNNPEVRMGDHRRKKNRNTDGWRVMYACETKVEAAHVEAMYQSVLGINGLNYRE